MKDSTICALGEKKCVPCEGGVSGLSSDQVRAMLVQVPGWSVTSEGKAIQRRFSFKNFKLALAFVNKVGEVAESEGHHPDISFGWGYVDCMLTTHAIKSLHENDFIVASKINTII